MIRTVILFYGHFGPVIAQSVTVAYGQSGPVMVRLGMVVYSLLDQPWRRMRICFGHYGPMVQYNMKWRLTITVYSTPEKSLTSRLTSNYRFPIFSNQFRNTVLPFHNSFATIRYFVLDISVLHQF